MISEISTSNGSMSIFFCVIKVLNTCLSYQTSVLLVQEPLRAAWWTARHQAYRRPPGRVQDVGERSPIASSSSPWSATGTLAASSALAAKPSWGTLAPPATAKGAWFCVGVTTSGERKEEVAQEVGERAGGEEMKLLVLDLEAVQTEQSVFLCSQTVWAQRGVQRLRPVDPSQRNGDEGTGKCLPPQGKSPALTSASFVSRCLFDRNIWDLVGRDSETERCVPCTLHLFSLMYSSTLFEAQWKRFKDTVTAVFYMSIHIIQPSSFSHYVTLLKKLCFNIF